MRLKSKLSEFNFFNHLRFIHSFLLNNIYPVNKFPRGIKIQVVIKKKRGVTTLTNAV